MVSPVCERCDKELKDWSGNIMVDSREFHERIESFKIICKDCTRAMDREGVGKRYHNLWELGWVKDNYFYHLGQILNDLMENGQESRWRYEAVNEFWKLGIKLYGADHRGPISSSLDNI